MIETIHSEIDKRVTEIRYNNKRFVEVKHGEWKTDFGIAFTCSACDRMTRKPYDFCPNCGADMREREENDE